MISSLTGASPFLASGFASGLAAGATAATALGSDGSSGAIGPLATAVTPLPVTLTWNCAAVSAVTSGTVRLSVADVGLLIVTAGPDTCVHAKVTAAPVETVEPDALSVKGWPS